MFLLGDALGRLPGFSFHGDEFDVTVVLSVITQGVSEFM
tara:strand:+ start:301 stop:417 length:117 start_codon:yes stop_codon:yes gene_type:complete